jgi:nucleoside-diphosphate-sugar epimerase
MAMRVLVTGATGFVGRVLCDTLARAGHVVRAAVRQDVGVPDCVSEKIVVGDIKAGTAWGEALAGVDAVVHLAARAHMLHACGSELGLYAEINGHATRGLAIASAQANIGRFIYLSSVKVNGEGTGDRAFTASDAPHPQDPYGDSKWLGEKLLAEVVSQTGMEAVVVRSPLVYGPGVRANFLRLMRWVDEGWLFPFGVVKNTRSLVSVWNLCDFIVLALRSSGAQNRTWMISDGADISTPQLVRLIGYTMNRRVRMAPVPVSLMRMGGALFGRGAEVERLCGSLVVDITPARCELGWSPPLTMTEGLERTVGWYVSAGKSLARSAK